MLSIETSVAALVLEHSECASVFDRYRIDYCCKGKQSLRVACKERSLDPTRVVDDLERAMRRRERPDLDPRALSTRELIVKLIAPHHQYLHRTLPFLVTLANKVARVHGDRHPSLRTLAALVETLTTTLSEHLDDEETTLFPALLANQSNAAMLLADMAAEHEQVGELLAQLREVADDFVPPDWACNSFRTLFAELEHLEADTLRHVHLENHALLPRFTRNAQTLRAAKRIAHAVR